jgi:hypothetical protein
MKERFGAVKFLALVFFLFFLPYVLFCCLLGFLIQWIWGIPWGISAFVAFLLLSPVTAFVEFVTGGAIRIGKLLARLRK